MIEVVGNLRASRQLTRQFLLLFRVQILPGSSGMLCACEVAHRLTASGTALNHSAESCRLAIGVYRGEKDLERTISSRIESATCERNAFVASTGNVSRFPHKCKYLDSKPIG